VDDQRIVGTSVARMLAGEADVDVAYRQTAAEAIEAALSMRPTVILQDLMMPDVTGAEMVRRYRAMPETADVPVIMLSGVEEPSVKADLLARGANDYLVKLPDSVELVARVRLHSEAFARLLERNTAFAALEEAHAELGRERERADRLLNAILPRSIADRLKAAPQVIAETHAEATVLFADICGFTELAASSEPHEVVAILDDVFGAFDRLATAHGVEKIKTIGDAWMAASGVPEPRADHASAMAMLALDLMVTFDRVIAHRGRDHQLRVGMHSGPVVAGVIGGGRFAYDLWGDTVNLASRMESQGEPGRIHLSASTAVRLGDAFETIDRGDITVKGKGAVRTAFLVGRRR
jgi:class 3 adenylate cyclase